MDIPHVDLRTPDLKPQPKRRARFVIFFITLFIAIGVVAFSTNVIFSEHPLVSWGNATFLGHLRALVQSADRRLTGEHADRVNILLLGMGGEGHEGPYLTDTIILVSYQPSTDKVTLISIPRDLSVTTPEFGTVKINAVNAFAEQRSHGSGGEATASVLSTLLDQPIAYWVRIDFRGFERAIDAVGGVAVTVDRAFSDPQFPVTDGDNQLKTVSFAAGTQHMDGKTALEFARSRHGSNGEGSDFARSKRQGKILTALREKLLRAGTLLNPFTIDQLIGTVRNSLQTNFETWEVLRLARQASNVRTDEMKTKVMSDANILESRINAEGAFVLIPKGGEWQLVRDFSRDVFSDSPTTPTVQSIRVEVQNGTSVPGLAQKTATALTGAGFTVVRVGNATDRTYQKSVIYDLSNNTKTDALVRMRTLIDANVAPTLPASLVSSTGAPPEDIDFILVVGKNTAL